MKTHPAILNPNVLLPHDCEAVYLPAAHRFNKELLTFRLKLLSRLPAVENKNSDRIYTKIQIKRDRHLWELLNISEMKWAEKTLILLAKTWYLPDPVSQSQITIKLGSRHFVDSMICLLKEDWTPAGNKLLMLFRQATGPPRGIPSGFAPHKGIASQKGDVSVYGTRWNWSWFIYILGRAMLGPTLIAAAFLSIFQGWHFAWLHTYI